MITLKELPPILTKIGIPVVYSHFTHNENTPAPAPPFMAYLEQDSDNFGADNRVYKKVLTYRIEVYTNKKDLALEKKIEDEFDLNGIFYDTDELFITAQDLYQRFYTIQLLK
ncbi:hypothetical protein [Lysinibacillus sp. NPDC086135]|uniref:hypothetical protein n=1 Tax=Lysinibacillus sp. NPDC086135 TaxID=3364130 RepID=UPI0037F80C7F